MNTTITQLQSNIALVSGPFYPDRYLRVCARYVDQTLRALRRFFKRTFWSRI